jgi:hypothetical protein
MTDNNSPAMQAKQKKDSQEQLAQQLFCAKAAYTSLTRPVRVSKKHENYPVVFNDIVQWIKGNHHADFIERAPLFIKKINADLTLRKLYLQLIKQVRFAESGLQAAASSGERLTERINEQFSLKFKRDTHFSNQVYVILTINNPTENHLNHAIALHITTAIEADCLYFPLLVDGRSQLLMEEDDKQLILLTDGNSHLYLA